MTPNTSTLSFLQDVNGWTFPQQPSWRVSATRAMDLTWGVSNANTCYLARWFKKPWARTSSRTHQRLYAFLSTTLDALRLSPSLSNLRTDAGLATSLTNTPPENFRFLAMPVVTADFDANRLLPKEPQNASSGKPSRMGHSCRPGTVYSDLNGNYFTVGENGEVIEGGNPRTDDEIEDDTVMTATKAEVPNL